MRIAQYFWDLKEESLKEIENILKNPKHPQFASRMTVLLSRCDKPEELFSIFSKAQFLDVWPDVRAYWMKRDRRSPFREWWQTLYEQLCESTRDQAIKVKGEAPFFFRKLGQAIKEARIQKGWSQKQLALRIGMRQPDISKIEEGKKNVTLFTLMRLCKMLEIRRVDLC